MTIAIAKHRKFGARLQAMQCDILEIAATPGLPLRGLVRRRAIAVERALLRLRVALEDELFREHGDGHPMSQKLMDGRNGVRVYFGTRKGKR